MTYFCVFFLQSPTSVYPYIVLISSVSSMLSLYGIIVMFKASKIHLHHYRLLLKFISLQSMVLLLNLQSFIFSTLGENGIPACVGILGSKVRAASKWLLKYGNFTMNIIFPCYWIVFFFFFKIVLWAMFWMVYVCVLVVCGVYNWLADVSFMGLIC